MRKIFQEPDSDKTIQFEFYDLELEIIVDENNGFNPPIINLTAKQAKKLYKFMKLQYEK